MGASCCWSLWPLTFQSTHGTIMAMRTPEPSGSRSSGWNRSSSPYARWASCCCGLLFQKSSSTIPVVRTTATLRHGTNGVALVLFLVVFAVSISLAGIDSNIPEETVWFIRRTHDAWGPVVIARVVLNWVIPFFALFPRPCKRSESVMLKIAVEELLGRWADLYIMIFPPVTGNTPVFGIPEVGEIIGLSSLMGLLFMRSFASAGAVPRNDPWLADSLHYHA